MKTWRASRLGRTLLELFPIRGMEGITSSTPLDKFIRALSYPYFFALRHPQLFSFGILRRSTCADAYLSCARRTRNIHLEEGSPPTFRQRLAEVAFGFFFTVVPLGFAATTAAPFFINRPEVVAGVERLLGVGFKVVTLGLLIPLVVHAVLGNWIGDRWLKWISPRHRWSPLRSK